MDDAELQSRVDDLALQGRIDRLRQPKTALDRIGGFVSRNAGAVADFAEDVVTGEKRRNEDLPDFAFSKFDTLVGGKGQPSAKMALARTDLGKLAILRDMKGEVPARLDDFGNVIVRQDDQEFFLNRPGASPQDVPDVVTAMAFEVPLAMRGGRAMSGLGHAGRAIGTGIGVAGGSVAQDALAQVAGSTEDIDLQHAMVAGALGASFEFAAPFVVPFFRRLFRNRRFYDRAAGGLTDDGTAALRRAGIDPENVTDDFVRRFEQAAKDAVDPKDIATTARMVEADDFGVRLSRGDASRDVVQQGREDLMLKGAQGGDSAKNIMRGFRESQADDILTARGRVQGELGGGQVSEPFQGTRAVQDRLLESSQAARRGIREGFDDARSRNASVAVEGVKDLARSVREGFRGFNPATAPSAGAMVKQLSTLERRFPGKVSKVSVRALEDWRQQVSALSRSNNSVERGAAGDLLRSYDDFMTTKLDDALISGDAGALDAFRSARRLRFQFRQKFEGNKIVEGLIETVDEGGEAFLKLEPSEATNVLFGASRFGKKGSTAAARRIKNVLGESSPEFGAIREEAFLRLFPDGRNAIGKFPGNFDRAIKDSPELMRVFFGPDEIRQIARFRNVVHNATGRVEGAINRSGTAIAGSRLVQDLFGLNPRTAAAFIARLLPVVVGDASGAARAVSATRAVIPKATGPAGLVGGVGAVGGNALLGALPEEAPSGRR